MKHILKSLNKHANRLTYQYNFMLPFITSILCLAFLGASITLTLYLSQAHYHFTVGYLGIFFYLGMIALVCFGTLGIIALTGLLTKAHKVPKRLNSLKRLIEKIEARIVEEYKHTNLCLTEQSPESGLVKRLLEIGISINAVILQNNHKGLIYLDFKRCPSTFFTRFLRAFCHHILDPCQAP